MQERGTRRPSSRRAQCALLRMRTVTLASHRTIIARRMIAACAHRLVAAGARDRGGVGGAARCAGDLRGGRRRPVGSRGGDRLGVAVDDGRIGLCVRGGGARPPKFLTKRKISLGSPSVPRWNALEAMGVEEGVSNLF